MKPKLIRILFGFSLVVFSLFSVEQLYAQDGLPADTYEGREERESLYSPGEPSDQRSKIPPSTVLKDSAAFTPKVITQQRAAKSAAENAKGDAKSSGDDSILSFNFLYYIIQKYKLQDIVD